MELVHRTLHAFASVVNTMRSGPVEYIPSGRNSASIRLRVRERLAIDECKSRALPLLETALEDQDVREAECS